MSDSTEISASFERPRSASVIAWVWIAIAVAGVVSGLKDFFLARKLAAVRPNLQEHPDAEALVDRFANLVGGTPLHLAVTVLVAGVIIAGAIGLLKLRSWGRLTLIAATWLALIGMLIGQPLLLWEITDLATIGEVGLSFFDIMLWTIGLTQLVFAVVIFGFMLRSLHGRLIRDAIRS